MVSITKQVLDVVPLGEPRSSWVSRSACRNSPFFLNANMNDINSIKACKDVCSSCPVLNKCLAYAIANEEKYDVWGGMTPAERKRFKSVMDVSHVPKEHRQYYLEMEGRVKRNVPTPRRTRNPALDLVIDDDFIKLLEAY
jgi:WhiB family redox-sensing transcriptional regulator